MYNSLWNVIVNPGESRNRDDLLELSVIIGCLYINYR